MVGRVRTARQRLAPAQRREEILAAATRVLMTADPAMFTFEEIAAEAGVSRALVYNYFGDKGALLAAVYTHAIAELDEQLLAALRTDRPVGPRLQAVVWHYVGFAQARQGTWQLLGHVAATRHPIVAAARLDRIGRLAAAVEDTPLMRLTVAALVGMLEEALTHWMAAADLSVGELSVNELSVDDVVARLELLVLSGVAGALTPLLTEFAS
ncbi:MAG: TetR/AcrR family transcriptional regulator [Acidimicrobiales bacterium]